MAIVGGDSQMSLRAVTDKIDGVLQGVALLVSVSIWAAFGFPFIPELVGFGCLVTVGIAFSWWMPSRRQSSVKNADRPKKYAEVALRSCWILQESGALSSAFLRFGILLLSDS